MAAQENWEELVLKHPATAIEKAESLIRRRLWMDMTQGILIKARAELLQDKARYPEILKALEKHIEESKHPIARCILSLATARLYLDYYNDNSWDINKRMVILSHVPEDMDEWSKNLFTWKISYLCRMALALEEALKIFYSGSNLQLMKAYFPTNAIPLSSILPAMKPSRY